jgi:transposase-like protein
MTGVLDVVADSEIEVMAKARRRRFAAEYKRRILEEAAVCRKPGELGALLRREGLYSSHLTAWRAAAKRGQQRIAALEREVRRLQARAERAEALVEVQKKLAELLGLELPARDGPR